jgi:hypothetical protein
VDFRGERQRVLGNYSRESKGSRRRRVDETESGTMEPHLGCNEQGMKRETFIVPKQRILLYALLK